MRFFFRVNDGDVKVAALFDPGFDTCGREALRVRDTLFGKRIFKHMITSCKN